MVLLTAVRGPVVRTQQQDLLALLTAVRGMISSQNRRWGGRAAVVYHMNTKVSSQVQRLDRLYKLTDHELHQQSQNGPQHIWVVVSYSLRKVRTSRPEICQRRGAGCHVFLAPLRTTRKIGLLDLNS